MNRWDILGGIGKGIMDGSKIALEIDKNGGLFTNTDKKTDPAGQESRAQGIQLRTDNAERLSAALTGVRYAARPWDLPESQRGGETGLRTDRRQGLQDTSRASSAGLTYGRGASDSLSQPIRLYAGGLPRFASGGEVDQTTLNEQGREQEKSLEWMFKHQQDRDEIGDINVMGLNPTRYPALHPSPIANSAEELQHNERQWIKDWQKYWSAGGVIGPQNMPEAYRPYHPQMRGQHYFSQIPEQRGKSWDEVGKEVVNAISDTSLDTANRMVKSSLLIPRGVLGVLDMVSDDKASVWARENIGMDPVHAGKILDESLSDRYKISIKRIDNAKNINEKIYAYANSPEKIIPDIGEAVIASLPVAAAATTGLGAALMTSVGMNIGNGYSEINTTVNDNKKMNRRDGGKRKEKITDYEKIAIILNGIANGSIDSFPSRLGPLGKEVAKGTFDQVTTNYVTEKPFLNGIDQKAEQSVVKAGTNTMGDNLLKMLKK